MHWALGLNLRSRRALYCTYTQQGLKNSKFQFHAGSKCNKIQNIKYSKMQSLSFLVPKATTQVYLLIIDLKTT